MAPGSPHAPRESHDETGDTPFVWLHIAGKPRGRIIPVVGEALRRMPELFTATEAGFVLRDAGQPTAGRSDMLRQAADRLRSDGLVPGWRDELCALLDESGTELARFERGAFRTLGLQNQAVHINGCLADGRLWIARRSSRKLSAPNKLDNMAAGAISAGESPADCAVRELWEEAGVSAELAVLVHFTGTRLTSLRPLRFGMHDEVILCADLPLPEDFTPVCQDGEVAEFLLLRRDEVQGALTNGEFSVEAGLVIGDWLARTGKGVR